VIQCDDVIMVARQVTLLLRCRGHTYPRDIEQQVNSYNRRMAGEPRTVSDLNPLNVDS